MNNFQLIAGSIAGTEHTKPGQPGFRNNQDAFVIHQEDGLAIGIVADGCGSGAHSEAGSRIIAQTALTALILNLKSFQFIGIENEVRRNVWRALLRAKQQILGQLSGVARGMTLPGESFGKVVEDHFLATLVGFVIMPHWSFVFHCGDGAYGVNGDTTELGPFPNNAPPYLAYCLTGSNLLEQHPELLDLQIATLIRTDEIDNLMVGCDGVIDFQRVEDSPLPGKTEPLGPLAQFWTDPRYTRNLSLLQRRLNMANRYVRSGAPSSKGLLPDDTTLVCAVRKQPETDEG